VVKHVVRRIVLTGCEEVTVWEQEEREVKERFLRGVGGVEGVARTRSEGGGIENIREVEVGDDVNMPKQNGEVSNREGLVEDDGKEEDPCVRFWDNDEGLEEIMRISKEV
jgi:anoctamin-10